MSAQEILDHYIADIAMHLPLKNRADIACELRALLDDDLHARAQRDGRPADEAMARSLIADFGHPDDVAARYRPAGLVIIPPESSSAFIGMAFVGVAIQWVIGIAVAVARINAGDSASIVLQHWFFSWGLGAFWWPGFMVACAAVAAWFKARKQTQLEIGGSTMTTSKLGRIGAGIGLPFAALFTVFYAAPGWIVSHIAPAGFDATGFTYTDDFRAERLFALLAYMTANVVVLGFVAFKGTESRLTRRLTIAAGVAGVAVMSWCVFGGAMFMLDGIDKLVRLMLAIIIFFALIDLAQRIARELIPSRPDHPRAN